MDDENSPPAHILVGRFGSEEHGYALVFASQEGPTGGAIWLSPSNAAPFVLVVTNAFIEGLVRVALSSAAQWSQTEEGVSWIIRQEVEGVWIFAGPGPGRYVAGVLIKPVDYGALVECLKGLSTFKGGVH